MITLPRACLLLVGGAVGDRWGPRRIMIAGDGVMLGAALVLAVAAAWLGTPAWLLLATGLGVGIVDAFYLPASGSMPRRLVGTDGLPRALALRQTGSQVITLAGAPLGGLLVAVAGLAGAAVADALTFGLVLRVLVVIRPSVAVGAPVARRNLGGEIADGVRVALRHPVLRPSLVLTAAAAGFLLPVTSLLLPLLCRSRHWPPASAGLVVAGQGLGVLLVALSVVCFGRLRRQGVTAACALVPAAVGTAGLAWTTGLAGAVASACLLGAGTGLFGEHMGPLILGSAPDASLSRVQALSSLVQSGALVVMNNVLGALAHARGPVAALAGCAGVLVAVAGLALASGSLRRADAAAP